MGKKDEYRLPDRPRRTDRPTTAELQARLAAARRQQAGREGQN